MNPKEKASERDARVLRLNEQLIESEDARVALGKSRPAADGWVIR